MKLKRLPVYKNTQSLSYDELLSTVRKTAEKSGAQIKSVTQENLPECEWVVSENSLYAVRAETDIGTVSAYVTGDVNIVFYEPVAGEGTGREAAEYFLGKYSAVTGFKDPVLCVIRYFDANGEELSEYRCYDNASAALKRVENYNFESVYFDINENDELESIRISSVDGAKKLGDYPAISLGEAEKLLLDGKYISGSADGIKDGRVTREKIKKTELVYSTDAMDSCFVPYYRFYVELDHSPVPGLKCYGEFDVPAIKGEYISE